MVEAAGDRPVIILNPKLKVCAFLNCLVYQVLCVLSHISQAVIWNRFLLSIANMISANVESLLILEVNIISMGISPTSGVIKRADTVVRYGVSNT